MKGLNNVNSCECSCTAGGNGYCNHMFLLKFLKGQSKNTLWFQSKRFKSTSCDLHLFANGNSKSLTANQVWSKYTRVTE